MLELFPEGFEEAGEADRVELAAYTDGAGEEMLRGAFGPVSSEPVRAGWERAWRSFHRPVRVGPVWVGPPWERPDQGALAVVVEPGLAFGTGAHPTTRLCLELLLELPRGSLVDIGCGAGVLAIAAAKLGFAPVYARDVDGVAVDVTRANAAANGVTLDIALGDALTDALPETAVAVANVTLDAVEGIAARVSARTLVASGYLAHDAPRAPGWRRTERREAEGWAADRFERP
jgi:ribosomal protein L11 methyltransferase